MRVSDFYFDLPDELIARYPKPDRTASRLLQLNGEMVRLPTALLLISLIKFMKAIY